MSNTKRFRFVFTGRKKYTEGGIERFKLNIPAAERSSALFYIKSLYEDVTFITK